jgi:glutamine amidotransferase
MKTVALVDHGLCNIHSIRRALEDCGAEVLVTDRPHEVLTADRIVLPGVGAFADAMARLKERGLDQALIEAVTKTQTPLLGICLGMQLLADEGEEGGLTPGLGLVPGRVVKLPSTEGCRIPHVGWNEVHLTRAHALLGVPPLGHDFYFVHSFHFQTARADDVLATTPYAGGFVSAVAKGAAMGVQFHPEKSQRVGFQVLRNFLAY